MCSTISPKIYEILESVVNGNIDDYKICVHDTNKKGEGYLGRIFFITLQKKDNGKQLNVVVKQAFTEKSIRDSQPIRDCFMNEIYFYKKLWPKFSKFQERIPSEYHFNSIPKCFTTSSEENWERLVIENLKFNGFVLHDKSKTLGKDMFDFIFKLYGRFHAISFAYKALCPEEFSELENGVIDLLSIFIKIVTFKRGIKVAHENCLDSIKAVVDNEVVEKYKHYLEDGIEIFYKSLESNTHSALLHGDCWSNNMMFKYDKTGNLVDLKLLDFQVMRMGSPVCDLSYCLYSGGTKEIFDSLDSLLRIYHNSLSENLRAYGCDPDEVYPFQSLRDDWRVHCQMGVTMALMLWKSKLTLDEDIIDLTDLTEEDHDEDTVRYYNVKYDEETYRERVKDIILHLYENDYLI